MVLCLLALPVFAVLGVFSVKYRLLAKDAMKCLFYTATLRRCESGLDDRMKSYLTGTTMRFSSRGARFVYQHYKLISWIVLIILVWSAYTSAVGLYNYTQYGNCNGPTATDFCVLDPTGQHSKISHVDTFVTENTIPPTLEHNDPIIGDTQARITIIEFGCYTCSYTQNAEPVLKQVLDHYEGTVNIQYKTFVIPSHVLSYESALAAECAYEQHAYKPYHDELFAHMQAYSPELFWDFAQKLDLNMTQFEACYTSERYASEITDDTRQGMEAGVYGTPYFFINDKIIVGPKPFKTFKKIIDEELSE